MGRWGRADFSQLRQLERQLERLERADFDKFCREAAKELAQRLLASVVKRTPVGQTPDWINAETKKQYWSGYVGGTLRRGWISSTAEEAKSKAGQQVQADEIKNWANSLPITQNGNDYIITVNNPLEYASYVEYGHRQQTGRYVPAIQRQLKDGWAPGHFMLTVSMQQIENVMPALLEKKLYNMLQRLF